ncbi:MerR family transcriptional regulator [Leuconostoc mesenteroides]|nr:MerR family transcriptional regulator [Leuconostoc mesenteroides]
MHIKEVSIQTGITQYTIRYYEKENLLLIPRDKNGIRTFNDKTINFKKIKNGWNAHFRNAINYEWKSNTSRTDRIV